MLLFQGDVEYAKGHGVVKLGVEVLKPRNDVFFIVKFNSQLPSTFNVQLYTCNCTFNE